MVIEFSMDSFASALDCSHMEAVRRILPNFELITGQSIATVNIGRLPFIVIVAFYYLNEL
jgi:hypothetical protein